MTAVVTVNRRIAAPAERLFDAWLDPASLSVWMRREGSDTTDVVADPRVGGSFSFVMNDATGSFMHAGTYTVIDRPRVLEFTWRSHATLSIESIVRVTFEPDGDATVVEVRHERLPDADAIAKHTEGWIDILGSLDRTFAPVPTPGEES
ncbi:MAG: SRPBCC domain-containing protein [Leifsonia sp.]